MTERPQLIETLKKESTSEVRRLLTVTAEGEVKLIELSGGHEKVLGLGTEYEMRKETQSVLDRFRKDGFLVRKAETVFEPLGPIVKLALRLEYTVIYDSTSTLDVARAIPIGQWPGCAGKGGEPYEYAFGHMRIYAQPKVCLSADLRTPKDGKEFVAALSKFTSMQKDVGPFKEFILGGQFIP